MPFLNNAGITAAGRVAVVDAPVTANGVLGAISFNANQAMVIDQTGGVADSVSGGLYFKAGALKCIVSEIALPGSQSYRDGLAFSPNGFLYINTTLPVASYVHGWPMGSNGSVCVTVGGVAPLGGSFSDGFSEGFD